MSFSPISMVLSAAKSVTLGGDRNICRHSIPDSSKNRCVAHAIFMAPLFQRLGDAINGYKPGVSAVVDLLHVCGPAAIHRAIAKIVFNAVDRVIVTWAWTHVGIEGFKRLFPSVAYGYAAPAIIRVAAFIGVGTPHFHTNPNSIFFGAGLSVRSHAFHIKAATRSGCQIFKVFASNLSHVAAIAFAQPAHASILVGRSRNNNKSSVTIAGYIYKSTHHFLRGFVLCR